MKIECVCACIGRRIEASGFCRGIYAVCVYIKERVSLGRAEMLPRALTLDIGYIFRAALMLYIYTSRVCVDREVFTRIVKNIYSHF